MSSTTEEVKKEATAEVSPAVGTKRPRSTDDIQVKYDEDTNGVFLNLKKQAGEESYRFRNGQAAVDHGIAVIVHGIMAGIEDESVIDSECLSEFTNEIDLVTSVVEHIAEDIREAPGLERRVGTFLDYRDIEQQENIREMYDLDPEDALENERKENDLGD